MLFVLSFITQIWVIEVLRVVFSSLLAWWCGALLAEVYVGRIKLKLWKAAPLALLCLPLAPTVFINVPPAILPLFDVAWALGFTGIIAGLFAWQRRGGSLVVLEHAGILAGFSYTLYVIHFPILVFISGWYTLNAPGNQRPQGVEWVFIGTGISLLAAWLAHFVVEKPFTRPRKSIEGRDKAAVAASS